MSKDYSRKRPVRQRRNAPGQLVVILAAFLGGYLTATVFDFTSLSTWINKTLLKPHESAPETKVAAKQAALPKPKFEFYTLLSKDNSAPAARIAPPAPVRLPQAEHAAMPSSASVNNHPLVPAANVSESKPVGPMNAVTKESYVIQIAAYNKRQDAEHLKASLVLRGFDVSIAEVPKQNIIWYRVTIGPFSSRKDAENAQYLVARNEHMKGMIRKNSP